MTACVNTAYVMGTGSALAVETNSKLAPVHPGEVLMEDFIEGFGITQNKLAVAIGGGLSCSCRSGDRFRRSRCGLALPRRCRRHGRRRPHPPAVSCRVRYPASGEIRLRLIERRTSEAFHQQ